MTGTVTAVLSCGCMTQVPGGTTLPEVTECPRSGHEREITAILGEASAR